MAKATKAQPAPEPDLAAQIRAVQAAGEALIEREVQKLKAMHPTLPADWHRIDLRARMKGGSCNCRCALALLEKETK